nr:MAG TPA: hypothetical protein [Caudoviricetes sp.]
MYIIFVYFSYITVKIFDNFSRLLKLREFEKC